MGLETLCNKERVDNLKNMLGFEGSFAVDVNGGSGGLALMWKYDGEVKITSFSRNHIDVVSLPWCVIGDMNNILSHEDKKGGRRYPEWLMQGFCKVVMECNLIDLDLVGHPFTWEKSRGTSAWVELRLDRALVTQRWMEIHEEALLYNIEISTSDHAPVLLEVD
ncbi:hypothetical protein AgCh_032239 [Apium graveolens]